MGQSYAQRANTIARLLAVQTHVSMRADRYLCVFVCCPKARVLLMNIYRPPDRPLPTRVYRYRTSMIRILIIVAHFLDPDVTAMVESIVSAAGVKYKLRDVPPKVRV